MASIVVRGEKKICVVTSYVDETGKRRQKWETFQTMSEAKHRKTEIEYQQQLGEFQVPNCKTMSELLKESASMVFVGNINQSVDVLLKTSSLFDQIHFKTLPPVLDNGFWSVTAYCSDDFLIDNPLNRYAINDRSAFELNEDGSLDIIVSASQPEQIGNWLPVNENEFHLYMRIYTPDMEAIETWDAPAISIIR